VATIEDFTAVFGEPIIKGDNMEKTVKITKIEDRVSETSGNEYWKVSTSPVLIPKKAWFINDEEQVALLEKEKYYHVEYHLNDKGYIQVDSFDETEDIHQDMKDEESQQRQTRTKGGDNKSRAFALSYAKDAVKDIYCAKAGAGQEIPDLCQMEDDIIAMAGGFLSFLE